MCLIEFVSRLQSDHEYASAAEDDEKNDNDVDESGSEADEGGEEQLFPEEESEKAAEGEEVVGAEERGAGDGQESQTGKHEKVDVDEDRRNPAYIPKRGKI
jgi:hypothetical protein